MSDMVRKQIYLEKRQVRAVRKKAEVLRMNVSQYIREAIDRDLYGSGGVPHRPDPAAWDEIETFLASQKEEDLPGEPYQFGRDEIYEERLGRFDGTHLD
jgi:hypothetical protein